MNPLQDLRDVDKSPQALKNFGLLVGGLASLIGLVLLPHPSSVLLLLPVGVTLATLGATRPQALRLPYQIWMGAAFLIGYVVSHLLLILLFYVIVTPIALAARSTGQDFLSLKCKKPSETYWRPKPQKVKTVDDHKHQF